MIVSFVWKCPKGRRHLRRGATSSQRSGEELVTSGDVTRVTQEPAHISPGCSVSRTAAVVAHAPAGVPDHRLEYIASSSTKQPTVLEKGVNAPHVGFATPMKTVNPRYARPVARTRSFSLSAKAHTLARRMRLCVTRSSATVVESRATPTANACSGTCRKTSLLNVYASDSPRKNYGSHASGKKRVRFSPGTRFERRRSSTLARSPTSSRLLAGRVGYDSYHHSGLVGSHEPPNNTSVRRRVSAVNNRGRSCSEGPLRRTFEHGDSAPLAQRPTSSVPVNIMMERMGVSNGEASCDPTWKQLFSKHTHCCDCYTKKDICNAYCGKNLPLNAYNPPNAEEQVLGYMAPAHQPPRYRVTYDAFCGDPLSGNEIISKDRRRSADYMSSSAAVHTVLPTSQELLCRSWGPEIDKWLRYYSVVI